MTSKKADRREWVRIATDLAQHPKLAALEDPAPAGWALVVAVLYCGRNLTDGVFPIAGVLREASVSRDVADQLVDAGAWHRTGHDCGKCPQPPAGHGYAHDYLEHNRSREAAEAARAAGRKAATVRHGRRRSATSEADVYGSHADRTADRNADSVRDSEPPEDDAPPEYEPHADRTAGRMRSVPDSQIPADRTADRMPDACGTGAEPSTEVEVEKEVTTDPPALRAGPPARAGRGSRLDPEWVPAVEVRDKLRDEFPNVDQRAEFAKFRDYWAGVPGAKGRKADWTATYRNWIRRAAENAPSASRRPAGRPGRTDRALAAVQAVQDKYGPGAMGLPRAIGGGS